MALQEPQGDDIVRSKTIAVASTNVSHTLDDGIFSALCINGLLGVNNGIDKSNRAVQRV